MYALIPKQSFSTDILYDIQLHHWCHQEVFLSIDFYLMK